MAETFLKAKCKITNKLFGLTIDNKDGRPYIRDFVPLEKEAYDALNVEYKVNPHIETASTLLPCKYCGTRKFGSCSCSKRKKRCSSSDKYDFQCVYCDELEFDYTSSKAKAGPYSKWVGVTNIPAKAFDRHGNPQGDEYDLAKDGSMNGADVIIIRCYSYNYDGWNWNYVNNALRKKGFNPINYEYPTLPSINMFEEIINKPGAQIWIISDCKKILNDSYYQAIINAYKNGHGLYIWGDNDPWNADANHLLKMIYGNACYMNGDYNGRHVISISKGKGMPGIVAQHPIAVGIQNFYEGITIAAIRGPQYLRPLVYSSDGNVVTAYDDTNGNRLLVDGGFTRLYCATDEAGTDRFVANCAVWLANVEKWDNRNLPEFR